MSVPVSQDVPVIERLNPLHYMKPEDYTSYWQNLFATVLHGFWARFFFYALLLIAFYVGIRQRNPTLAAICIGLAAIIAYGAGAMGIVKSIHW
jgi:hypothetical protein